MKSVSYTHLDVYKRQAPLQLCLDSNNNVIVSDEEHEKAWEKARIKTIEGITYTYDVKTNHITAHGLTKDTNCLLYTSITAAYGQIVPQAVLDIPRLGCINVHASLLPQYRGGAPVHQAIIDGHDKTGVTIMYMVKKMDAGNIISQKETPILDDDNVDVYKRQALYHLLS